MFAVIFEVNPRQEAWDLYLQHAATLRPELLCIDGFIANERYASLTRPGWLVSLSLWRDEKALVRWRTHAVHHDIQGKGRSSVFADYHLRVGEVVSDTASSTPMPRQRYDTTEAAALKFVTLTETTDRPAAPAPEASDAYDSITRPGHFLSLHAWPDLASARTGIAAASGHHCTVEVIRDYGMFARTEAPQYFPACPYSAA